jgi:type I restriction enzyme S subunit
LRFPEFEDEWKSFSFRDIVQMFSGGTPSMRSLEYWGGDIPFISAASMHDVFISKSDQYITREGLQNGSKLLKKGNLLLLVRGSMLWNRIPVCYNTIDIAFNQDVKGLVTNDKTSALFMFYWLQSKESILKYKVTGTGIGAGKLDSADILDLLVILPYNTEQSKIEKLLSLIDERITAQSKIIEVLKSFKISVRNRLFEQIPNRENEALPIKDILEYEQPNKYIVSNTNYSPDSSFTPVLTANKAFILGYTDEVFGIYDKGECIILDDFTMDIKYVDFPFKVKSSAIKILTPKPNVNLKFIFEYLIFLDLQAGGHKRHYISEIEAKTIALPDLNKQNSMAKILSTIDQKIELETAILNLFTKQKQYLLQQMFI